MLRCVKKLRNAKYKEYSWSSILEVRSFTSSLQTWKDKVLTSLQNQLLSSCEMLAFKNHGHFSSHELHTACGGKMPFPPASKTEFEFLDSWCKQSPETTELFVWKPSLFETNSSSITNISFLKKNYGIMCKKDLEWFSGNIISKQILIWEVWLMLQTKASIISDWLMKLVIWIGKFWEIHIPKKDSWIILQSIPQFFSGMWWL